MLQDGGVELCEQAGARLSEELATTQNRVARASRPCERCARVDGKIGGPLQDGLAVGRVVDAFLERSVGTGDQALSVPVYILFFAVAGTKFDPKLMGEVWYYVLALVALRTLSIWTGTKIGVKLSGMEPPASKWIWTAFVPQAGISLALAVIVADQFEGLGFSDKVYAILLSAIAIHELAGPILFKLGLKRAGEVLPSAGGR